jgi:hypothetical protein
LTPGASDIYERNYLGKHRNLRTGSIGNRDAETLVNTLPEPKKSILRTIRSKLLSLGFSEEAGYDAINIESYVAFSARGTDRFFLKHKWEVVVVLMLESENEKQEVEKRFPRLLNKDYEKSDDSTISVKLNPQNEEPLIFELAEYFARQKQTAPV